MLVRPQHRPVQIVQHTVAVRPEKGHVTGSLDKTALQVIIAGLGKARGETDSAAAPHRRQVRCDLDHRMPVDSQKRRIRR